VAGLTARETPVHVRSPPLMLIVAEAHIAVVERALQVQDLDGAQLRGAGSGTASFTQAVPAHINRLSG
jgi:hypothetical protein